MGSEGGGGRLYTKVREGERIGLYTLWLVNRVGLYTMVSEGDRIVQYG